MTDQRRRARIGFALLGLVIPVQLVVDHVASEPYPGLFMPAFGNVPLRNDRLVQTFPEVTVIFTDGGRERISPSDLVAESAATPKVAAAAMLRTNLHPEDPATISWVRERVSTKFPARHPKTVLVTWVRSIYSASDLSLRDRRRLETYRIEVG